MKKKLFLGFLTILMAVIVSLGIVACKGNEGEKDPPDDPTPSGFGFSEDRIEILLGETRQLTLVALEEGETVTNYSSNDTAIVTVDDEGLIEGVGIGQAVVRATTSLERAALVQITVNDPEFYPVPYFVGLKDAFTLNAGDEYALEYSVAYKGEVISATVTASSDNAAVATASDGAIIAVGAGEANITFSATSAFGTATKIVKVTVLESQTEFFLSLLGKNIYVGKEMELAAYAFEKGEIKEISGATFSVEDTSVATVSGNVLSPEKGGDTTVVASFTYGGEAETFSYPIHVYGLRTCTISLLDGTTDCVIEAFYGDTVPLVLKNADDNPEYERPVKSWYLDGEKLTGESFIMPDRDVELLAVFVNETDEDFSRGFTSGHLLNDLSQGKAVYVEDEEGDLGGYVRIDCLNWASLNYFFDEPVIINEYSTVRLKLWLPQEAAIVYFGVATTDVFNSAKPTNRYNIGRDDAGTVPFLKVDYEQWITVELPLSDFVEVGEKLGGISICVSSHSYVLVEYISVYYGLDGGESEVVLENAPAVTGDATYTGDQIVDGNYHGLYATETFGHYYMTQVNKGSYDATFTFSPVNYGKYGEVVFGMFAMTAGDSGKIIVGDQTLTIDNQAHYYRIVIKDGVLTMYNDNQGGSGEAVLTTTLSSAILSGEESLVISVDFDAWSQVEFTETYLRK